MNSYHHRYGKQSSLEDKILEQQRERLLKILNTYNKFRPDGLWQVFNFYLWKLLLQTEQTSPAKAKRPEAELKLASGMKVWDEHMNIITDLVYEKQFRRKQMFSLIWSFSDVKKLESIWSWDDHIFLFHFSISEKPNSDLFLLFSHWITWKPEHLLWIQGLFKDVILSLSQGRKLLLSSVPTMPCAPAQKKQETVSHPISWKLC